MDPYEVRRAVAEELQRIKLQKSRRNSRWLANATLCLGVCLLVLWWYCWRDYGLLLAGLWFCFLGGMRSNQYND